MTGTPTEEATIDQYPQVTIRRDPAEGVVAETRGPASSVGALAAELLAVYGFSRRSPEAPLTLRAPIEGSATLHLRDLVGVLRRSGVRVAADPQFQYLADPESPGAAQADPRILFAQARPRMDVAVGQHPDLGVVAKVPHSDPAAANALAAAGFERVADSNLYRLQPMPDPTAWTTTVVARLRGQGLRVSADLAFEPPAAQPAPSLRERVTARALAATAVSTRAPAVQPARPALAQTSAPGMAGPRPGARRGL